MKLQRLKSELIEFSSWLTLYNFDRSFSGEKPCDFSLDEAPHTLRRPLPGIEPVLNQDYAIFKFTSYCFKIKLFKKKNTKKMLK